MGQAAQKLDPKKGDDSGALTPEASGSASGGNLVPSAKKEESSLFSLKSEQIDFGPVDSLRFKILSSVLNENYDSAIKGLRDYTDKPSPYPDFKDRVARYIKHGVDLTYAIKAKRGFPGLNSLTRAKQQELREKFKEHFKELQWTLRKIEKIERGLEIEDVRSTIYVVKALWLSGIAIVVLAFAIEIMRSMALDGYVVIDDLSNKFTEWLFSFF